MVVEGGVLTPASALGSSAAPAGLSWLNCAPLLYCGHDLPAAAPSAPTKSRHHTNRLVCLSPPTGREGVRRGGATTLVLVYPRSTLTLSNELLSRDVGGKDKSSPQDTPPRSFTTTTTPPSPRRAEHAVTYTSRHSHLDRS